MNQFCVLDKLFNSNPLSITLLFSFTVTGSKSDDSLEKQFPNQNTLLILLDKSTLYNSIKNIVAVRNLVSNVNYKMHLLRVVVALGGLQTYNNSQIFYMKLDQDMTIIQMSACDIHKKKHKNRQRFPCSTSIDLFTNANASNRLSLIRRNPVYNLMPKLDNIRTEHIIIQIRC